MGEIALGKIKNLGISQGQITRLQLTSEENGLFRGTIR